MPLESELLQLIVSSLEAGGSDHCTMERCFKEHGQEHGDGHHHGHGYRHGGGHGHGHEH